MNMPRRSNASSRFWRWRTRSTKSASESDTRDRSPSLSLSPLGPAHISPSTPLSPFLTESAHVLSLQNPDNCSPSTRLSEVQLVSPGSTSFEEDRSSSKLESLIQSDIKIPIKPTVPCTPNTAKSLYLKTVKSLESRFRARVQVRREVRILTHPPTRRCCPQALCSLTKLTILL